MEQPYAPDVRERETSDDGFARGWGAHFQPSERYWIDCHTHMREDEAGAITDFIDTWTDRLDAWRLRRTVSLDGSPENADEFGTAARENDRFLWLAWPRYDEPNLDGLETCLEAGASGMKLHNAPLIRDAADPTIWNSEAWDQLFERLAAADLPVLWHVTQRLTDSPYTGGNRNSYWKEGWENGAEFTNEDLLQVFLSVVADHPETNFIGAHQLHLGFDRLHELLRTHSNLYIDTSIGCFVRWGDDMYPEDRERAREFFMEWSDRICFGTDCVLGQEAVGEHTYQQFLGHVRYIHQLNLRNEALQNVSHRNIERLMGLETLPVPRKGALRP